MDIGTLTHFFVSIPADWIAIGVFAILFLVDALRVGCGRISAASVAFLTSVFVWKALQSAAFLSGLTKQFSTPVLQALLFGILLVLMYFLLRRIFVDYGDSGGQPIQAIFASIAATALIALVWVEVPVLSSVWNFGPTVHAVFGEAYRFWWLIGSFAALAFARN